VNEHIKNLQKTENLVGKKNYKSGLQKSQAREILRRLHSSSDNNKTCVCYAFLPASVISQQFKDADIHPQAYMYTAKLTPPKRHRGPVILLTKHCQNR
jgi:hypothetical protein